MALCRKMEQRRAICAHAFARLTIKIQNAASLKNNAKKIWEDQSMLSLYELCRRKGSLVVSFMAIVLSIVVSSAAGAVDFSGKRVTILVPFSEGGGTDSWTRMLAPYYEKALPGNPKVIVLNRPGAGGITGANYYEEKAPADGSMIFALSISTVLNYAFHDPRIKFRLEDYHPVLNSPRSTIQFIHKDLGVGGIKSLKERIKALQNMPPEKINFGGRTPTSSDLTHRVGLSLLGIEVNSVWGMGGTGPMAIAFERGEFQTSAENSMAFLNSRSHLLNSGTAQPLFTLGNFDADGNYGRDPVWPDVPTLVECYEAVFGKKPSGPGFEAWWSLIGLNVPMNKTLMLHPKTPKDVVETWRKATRAVLADKDFLKIALKELGPYPQIVGEPARQIMLKALAIPPESRAWLAKFVKVRYNLDLEPKKKKK